MTVIIKSAISSSNRKKELMKMTYLSTQVDLHNEGMEKSTSLYEIKDHWDNMHSFMNDYNNTLSRIKKHPERFTKLENCGFTEQNLNVRLQDQ